MKALLAGSSVVTSSAQQGHQPHGNTEYEQALDMASSAAARAAAFAGQAANAALASGTSSRATGTSGGAHADPVAAAAAAALGVLQQMPGALTAFGSGLGMEGPAGVALAAMQEAVASLMPFVPVPADALYNARPVLDVLHDLLTHVWLLLRPDGLKLHVKEQDLKVVQAAAEARGFQV